MRHVSTCLLAAFSLGWSLNAQATLISRGDYTRDTATNLDWLDVNLTVGVSYNAILGGAGGYIPHGWRYATGGEIDALAMRYIGSPEQTFVGGVDFLQTLFVIALLSPTFQRDLLPDAQATIATLGYYDDGGANPNIGLGEFVVTLLVPDPAFGIPFTGRWTTFDEFLAPNTVAPQIGNFLVRDVPEPPMLLAMLLGIVVYAVRSRPHFGSLRVGRSQPS
jgi:hypothetical protein